VESVLQDETVNDKDRSQIENLYQYRGKFLQAKLLDAINTICYLESLAYVLNKRKFGIIGTDSLKIHNHKDIHAL
jgi:hypothetical protein